MGTSILSEGRVSGVFYLIIRPGRLSLNQASPRSCAHHLTRAIIFARNATLLATKTHTSNFTCKYGISFHPTIGGNALRESLTCRCPILVEATRTTYPLFYQLPLLNRGIRSLFQGHTYIILKYLSYIWYLVGLDCLKKRILYLRLGQHW